MTASRWYFLHIPKTAGSTLIHVLSPARLCPAREWPSLIAIPERRLAHYHGFAGHFGYALAEYLNGPLRMFTFLRHPLDHVLSAYAHLLRDPSHRLHHQAHAMTLASFLREFAIMRNPQTRWLARDVVTSEFRHHRDSVRVDQEIAHAIARTEAENETSPQDLLRRAADRLESFELIGFVESYETDVRRLLKMLDLPLRGSLPTLNRAPRRCDWKSLTGEEQALIEQGLQLDFALYDRAKQIANPGSSPIR